MSNEQRSALVRLSFRKDKQTFGILSIWPGKFAGLYDVSRDKDSVKYPTIGLFEALKSWGQGTGYLQLSIESEREQRGGTQTRTDQPVGGDDFGGGVGFDDEIPFAPVDERTC